MQTQQDLMTRTGRVGSGYDDVLDTPTYPTVPTRAELRAMLEERISHKDLEARLEACDRNVRRIERQQLFLKCISYVARPALCVSGLLGSLVVGAGIAYAGPEYLNFDSVACSFIGLVGGIAVAVVTGVFVLDGEYGPEFINTYCRLRCARLEARREVYARAADDTFAELTRTKYGQGDPR